MSSIKLKFTFFLTTTVFVVVIVFSGAIYSLNVAKNRGPLPPREIERIAQRHPRIGEIIEENNNLENISQLSETIREEEREKFRATLFMLVPPTLLISAILSYFVSSYLVKPVEDIAVFLAQVESGKFSTRIPVTKSSNEIEMLVESFNEMLDKLEESYKIEEQFISDAAHELRTPLAAMKTTIQVFNQDEKNATTKDYKNLVKVLEEINNKLVRMSENLIMIHRRTIAPREMREVDLENLVEDILEGLSPLITHSEVEIQKNFNKIPRLTADYNDMVLVFTNLIENAIKYSNPKGKIVINLSSNSKDIIAEIIDEGIGIEEDEIERVFDRFYRARNTNNIEGGGLGLSIVKKNIELYQGIIEIESKVGKGTKIQVRFPKSRL